MPADYSVSGDSVCQVTFRGTLFGQTVMNTFHYRLDAAGGVLGTAGAFLDDFNGALDVAGGFYTKYVDCLPPQLSAISADLQWIDRDRFVKRTFSVAAAGTFVHTPTTANLSACIELRANIADRRSIGTKHIPGLGGNAVAAGLLTGGLTAQLEAFVAECCLDVAAAGRTMRPIVFGRARLGYTDRHGVVHPPIPTSYREIVSGTVQTTARVLRRRTVGLGI